MEGFLFFVVIVTVGYLAAKFRLVPKETVDCLPGLLLNVCYPLMIFSVFQTTDYDELIHTALPFLLAAVAISFALFGVSLLSFKKSEPKRRSVLRLLLCAGNTSFVIVPLFGLFLSKEAMVCVFLYDAIQNLFLWTLHHEMFLGSAISDKKLLLKKAISPCMIACLLGMALSWLELPTFLTYLIEQMKPVVSPLAFLLLGMIVEHYGLFSWRRNLTSLLFTAGKVLLLPCILFAVLYFVLPLQTAILLALMFGAPPPIVSIIWSKEYGGDTKLAVECLIPATVTYLLAAGALLLTLTRFGVIR